MEFGVLGPLTVVNGGVEFPLGGQKQRSVLALLLLEANRVVSTDTLVEALWGERPPRTAATSLQNFISQLRRVVGPDVLETRPPGYLLRVQPSQLDVDRFRGLREQAKRALPEERAQKLREALALWRGPALSDFAYDSFAQSEIGRLEELRLATLEDLFDSELEAGVDAALVGELETVVAEQPLRERLRGQLMLALYRAGRQADALATYQDARRALVDELGIEPGRDLQRLYGAILRHEAGLDASGREPTAEDQLEEVVKALLSGRLIPVLGAEVGELASRLAERFEYPRTTGSALPSVSQYIAVTRGSGPLYDELHALLDADAVPTAVHRFFATLPPLLRERGLPHQLIVTTSYDLALEQAFVEAGEEIDVVSYVAAGRNRGKFCHVRPDGTASLIDVPNTYASELSLERRTIVLKVHGQVDRTPEREWESFVVTEDDYIDYLAQTDVANVVPVGLAARLRRSHFLFLGYTMANWHLRLILHRLWGDQPLTYRSWAVQPDHKPLEAEFWRRRDVEVLELALEDYVTALARSVGLERVESPT